MTDVTLVRRDEQQILGHKIDLICKGSRWRRYVDTINMDIANSKRVVQAIMLKENVKMATTALI